MFLAMKWCRILYYEGMIFMNYNKPLATAYNNARLRERIDRNYNDFKERMLGLDNETLYCMASTIASMDTVYTLMSELDWVGEEDAAYLLRYEYPLQVLADGWHIQSVLYGSDFEDFISDFVAESKWEQDANVELVNGLHIKYGADTPLFEIALVELVDLCNRLLDCKDYREDGEANSVGKGGGFWQEA